MRKVLRNAGIFILCWFGAMIVFSVIYKVYNTQLLWQIFLIPAAFFAIIITIATLLEQHTHALRKVSFIFLLAAIALDQSIKIYLFSTHWQVMDIAVISPVFHINPSHNTLGSYLWVLIGWEGASNIFNVFLVLILGSIFVEFWRFYRKKRRNSLWINLFANFFIAGALCNMIDNLFHGGSLDYLTIKPFYTTDMKDLYITLALLFVAIEVFDNKLYKKDSNINSDFSEFFKNDLKKLFKRKKSEN